MQSSMPPYRKVVDPAKARKYHAAALALCGVVILAEAILSFVAIPHGIRATHYHDFGWIANKFMTNLTQNIATLSYIMAFVTILSIIAIAYLSNQTKVDRAGLIWSALFGMLAMGQLNLSNALDESSRKLQGTNSEISAALVQARYPAVATMALMAVFLIWHRLASQEKKEQPA